MGPLPASVDFRKLAERRASLNGSVPIESFSRLRSLLLSYSGDINIELSFEPGKGSTPRVTGQCRGRVVMECQNCLEAVEVAVEVDIDSVIVVSVEQLLALEQEDDGIVCKGAMLPLVDIIEDDLLVSLPMVPRHDGRCGETYSSPNDETPDTYRPFAGLERLKKDSDRSE